MSSFDQVQGEYSEDYCTLLETAYGKGFLSEGGIEAIDDLVKGLKLDKKEILDIGSGLGAAAIHFAQKYNATTTGIEINQSMVDEANRRVLDKLQKQVKFLFYNDINHLPFEDESFELAFSKGVFLHLDVEDKLTLFKEVFRVLKKDSYFVIGDWLSPVNGHWGEKMAEMIKLDGLTIFANTEEDYREVIRLSGLKLFSIEKQDETYSNYNKKIVKHLERPEIQSKLMEDYSKEEIENTIKGYGLLYDAIQDNELLIRKIICKK